MAWLAGIRQFALPDHCEPENDFLLHVSTLFSQCVPTPLALVSSSLGILSIIAWLFAQLPQIYKNWVIQSTSGLSIFFLVEWCLGDVSNLLGALFTHQASWQVAIGAYYVFVDLCLVGQWIWYERLKHGHPVFSIWKSRGQVGKRDEDRHNRDLGRIVIEGMSTLSSSSSEEQVSKTYNGDRGKEQAKPGIVFEAPAFRDHEREDGKPSQPCGQSFTKSDGTTIHKVGSSAPVISPSPRTVLMIACLIAVVSASPVRSTDATHITEARLTTLEVIGTALAWLSSVLYLGSRLPQLFKNWQRKSTAGLSPYLFIAAFCGNLFYSSALVTNPNVWNDYGSYGGGGWAGEDGNDQMQWILAALPFFLGAAGVLGLDASVGVQFLLYGGGAEEIRIIDTGHVDSLQNGGGRWRKVSGWMRGWIPSMGASKGIEHEALIQRDGGSEHHEGYRTISHDH